MVEDIYSRGQLYQLVNGVSRVKTSAASAAMDAGPGRKYPRFCLLVGAVVVLTFLSYLPHLQDRPRPQPAPFLWPHSQTRDVAALVRPDSVTTLVPPSRACAGNTTSQQTYLLVVVCSAVKNFEARQAIRNSWAKDQTVLKDVSVVFLVGQLLNSDGTDRRLAGESEKFGDILQEGFIDSYANLTVKSLMLLKWFGQNCDGDQLRATQQVQYVFKTDDDMYINLVKLREIVASNKKTDLLMGSLICSATPIKDPFNKW